jgi:hypothetical protein
MMRIARGAEEETVQSWTDEAAMEILPLIGERVRVLHPRRQPGMQEDGGGDIDCAVSGLDPRWPLRLRDGWRLCQRLHYDVGESWAWVLEREGQFLSVDALEDPTGIGRLGFPTSLALDGSGLEASPAARAAYLTAKRLNKGIDAPEEWSLIGELARQDPKGFLDRLNEMFGAGSARSLAAVALFGRAPDPSVRRRSLRRHLLKRLGRDLGVIRWPVLRSLRVVERLVYPTGLCVLVVGPDGAGKSTLTESLAKSFEPLFGSPVRLHWRPGVLPTPGAVISASQGDPANPHGRPPHGALLSLLILLYQWADFELGGFVSVLPIRARSGLVLWERGWWDTAVDPLRYRLRVPKWVVRSLGRMLPGPDLALVVEAPPSVLRKRKGELDSGELARQTSEWRDVLPRRIPRVYLDGTKDATQVSQTAREAVLRFLEERSVARLGPGWARVPGSRSGTFLVPRASRSASVGSLCLHHPVTRGQLGMQKMLRAATSIGALRLAPRAPGPPRAVREALAPYLQLGESIAVARSSHRGRYVAAILSRDGKPRAVAKVATGEAGSHSLANEARVLRRVHDSLRAPLLAPRVLAHEERLLLLEAVPWHPRMRPWLLPEEVAHALGALFASTMGEAPDGPRGFSHGDCTPRNLLQAPEGWFLVDWEMADEHAVPFSDVFHYLVQSHGQLLRPSRKQLLDGVTGSGWVGAALEAYADGAGLPMTRLDEVFASYLHMNSRQADPTRHTDARGPEALRKLWASLRARS